MNVVLHPFFTYFGGKYRIAPRYPSPKHTTIIESFAGSAGYSVRHAAHKVILYETNPKVFGVWHYLINVKESEIIKLPLEIEDVRCLRIPQEAQWLIGFWLNKGHTMPCYIPGRWMRDGTRPNSFWGEVIRKRIALQLQYIRHWQVFNKSFEAANIRVATWFIDPPYQQNPSAYGCEINYEILRDFVLSRKGQIIVCEAGTANWLPFKPFRDAVGLRGSRGCKISKEVVWTNL